MGKTVLLAPLVAPGVSSGESALAEDVHGGGDVQSAHHRHPAVLVTAWQWL